MFLICDESSNIGHNGAGKSSVISMITGMTTITGGQCSVYDQPLPDALATVRTMTGICPQQNVLFPSLTVVEHLRYFGCIKGLYGQKLTDEVLQMTADIGLLAKKDAPAASLSGGMKRKLQLAIALIGGSKFLILDEPTSGTALFDVPIYFKICGTMLIASLSMYQEWIPSLGEQHGSYFSVGRPGE